MKIQIEEYDPEWGNIFGELKQELSEILSFLSPVVEHIGSTAVPGLAAKPIIDVALGIRTVRHLDKTVGPLTNAGYIYYKAFNGGMPNRRLFVGLKNRTDSSNFPIIFDDAELIPHAEINKLRKCHIHVWEYGSSDWVRHIAFREYLKHHPGTKEAYGKLKWKLGFEEWEHGMAYNDGKNDFVKAVQAHAMDWYKTQIR